MKIFAGIMGISSDERKYETLAEQLKKQIKAEFWDKPFVGNINKQTLFSTLLYHQIITHEDIPVAMDSLLNAVKNGPASHFNTGIFGTKYILETLSANGSANAVFEIVNSKKYPGWGYMIDQGATTIWETWKESDNTYSNCHPMFGTVTEWYYRWLAGIRPDPDHPGFKEFFITPTTPEGLDSINCVYQAPHGAIVSSWKKIKPENYIFEISIPESSKANIKLPISASQILTIKNKNIPKQTLKINGLQTGKFSLPEGDYVITLEPKK
jgi:alpha-L-rhamnosidase